MRRNSWRVLGILVGVLWLAPKVQAEPIIGNPFGVDQTTVTTSNSSTMADGLANGITGKVDLNSAAFTTTQQQLSDDDRRNQAKNAESKANNGAAAHAVSGALMTATAIPMLASPIIPVRVAGAALMAKAALEFAQAGADKGVANKNGAQKDLLSKNAAQEKPATPNANTVNTPEMQKLLADRGVNSDDFAKKLTNGELTSPEEVLKAVGDNTEVSPEDAAKGMALADDQTNKILAENNQTTELKRLGYDESAGKDGMMAGKGGGGLDGGVLRGSDGKGKDMPHDGIAALGGSNGSLLPKTNFVPNVTSPSGAGSAKEGTAVDLALARLLAGGLPGADGKLLTQLAAERLAGVGILRANPLENIFRVAHRNYRAWSKWRLNQKKGTKLAAIR